MNREEYKMKLKRVLSAAALLTTVALPAVAEPVPRPDKHPLCQTDSQFAVVDASIEIPGLHDERRREALDIFSNYGVKTIFRYYSFYQPSLPQKILHKKETDAILAKKMSIGTVFQKESDDPATFMISGKMDNLVERPSTLE